MLPLKVLKKQGAYNVIGACLKRSKELPHQSSLIEACHEHPPGPISAVSSYWRHRFETEGVPEPVESIEHIIAHVIGSGKDAEAHEKDLDSLQLEKLITLCNRRLMRMPLKYVTEEVEFKGTRLKLAPPIFIPEEQTEILVDLLLKHIERSSSKVCTVLEVGCGVGAISLSLLRSCNSVEVIAIDKNVIACELAYHNAQNLGLESRLNILHATLEENGEITTTANLSSDLIIDFQEKTFDFIVSNPPCTPTRDIPKLKNRFEDDDARDGGEDGMKVIKPLLTYASKHLSDDGILLMEVYPSQPDEIKFLMEKHYQSKLRLAYVYKDLTNNERVLEITKIG